MAELRNIFDKSIHTETSYCGFGICINKYELLPSEMMLSAQFNHLVGLGGQNTTKSFAV